MLPNQGNCCLEKNKWMTGRSGASFQVVSLSEKACSQSFLSIALRPADGKLPRCLEQWQLKEHCLCGLGEMF